MRRRYKRLDQFLYNVAWNLTFLEERVQHIENIESNHKLLQFNTSAMPISPPKMFRFEPMWQMDPQWKNVVHNTLSNYIKGSPSYIIIKKRKRYAKERMSLPKNHFGKLEWEIKQIKDKLTRIMHEKYALIPIEYMEQEEGELLDRYRLLLIASTSNGHKGQEMILSSGETLTLCVSIA